MADLLLTLLAIGVLSVLWHWYRSIKALKRCQQERLRSRGLGDVYKRQTTACGSGFTGKFWILGRRRNATSQGSNHYSVIAWSLPAYCSYRLWNMVRGTCRLLNF